MDSFNQKVYELTVKSLKMRTCPSTQFDFQEPNSEGERIDDKSGGRLQKVYNWTNRDDQLK